MSTFRGIVAEFPQIRIDHFRHQPEHRPPLACFLSHVHSDHLTGLESLRAPFVYCSAATREVRGQNHSRRFIQYSSLPCAYFHLQRSFASVSFPLFFLCPVKRARPVQVHPLIFLFGLRACFASPTHPC